MPIHAAQWGKITNWWYQSKNRQTIDQHWPGCTKLLWNSKKWLKLLQSLIENQRIWLFIDKTVVKECQ